MPEGMEWDSFNRGNQRLIKTDYGYERNWGGKMYHFDNHGNFIKLDNGNDIYTDMEYKNNIISKMINSDGSELFFKTNSDGYIIEINSNLNNGYAIFEYDGQNLVYSKGMLGDEHGYEYDDKHNIIKIIYNPKKSEKDLLEAMYIEYDGKTNYCSKIIDKNGEEKEYGYNIFYLEDGSIDDNHYGTLVTQMGFDNKPITNNYEYFIGNKNNGESFTKKIITEISGITTKTEYDELCENPSIITRGTKRTTFKYNNRCLL